jgi:hypothetical protein
VKLVEGVDFYWECGLMVLTPNFLLLRGKCCNSGCRHCPYHDEEINPDGTKNNIARVINTNLGKAISGG